MRYAVCFATVDLFLGVYGFMYLPNDLTSFDIAMVKQDDINEVSLVHYLPLIGFNLLQFFGNFGLFATPNMMMCETSFPQYVTLKFLLFK